MTLKLGVQRFTMDRTFDVKRALNDLCAVPLAKHTKYFSFSTSRAELFHYINIQFNGKIIPIICVEFIEIIRYSNGSIVFGKLPKTLNRLHVQCYPIYVASYSFTRDFDVSIAFHKFKCGFYISL